ncbi:zinc C3HC4 type domain-containing protein [Cryptosporidium andersoni]|uniref:Zinc C3HC4 type domain-containing protein n=1 Tax=Cryptosporidium andersoni TaxID=117008 RepID=A0A1J4MYJ7_9CRYT|nr:zinc C3HC4 type domain-containing protein [Cryptosporidium andersoni]
MQSSETNVILPFTEENEVHDQNNQVISLKKKIIRSILIVSTIIPVVIEIYFLIPNLNLLFSNKQWIYVPGFRNFDWNGSMKNGIILLLSNPQKNIINLGEDHKEIDHFKNNILRDLNIKKKNTEILNSQNIMGNILYKNGSNLLKDKENNEFHMDSTSIMIHKNNNIRGTISDDINNLNLSFSSNIANNVSILKFSKLECDCPLISSYYSDSNNYSNQTNSDKYKGNQYIPIRNNEETQLGETEQIQTYSSIVRVKSMKISNMPYVNNTNFLVNNKLFSDSTQTASLFVDSKNWLVTPITEMILAFILICVRWLSVLCKVIVEFLTSIKVSIGGNYLKTSSMFPLIYIGFASTSILIIGIQGQNCITWWFLGSNPLFIIYSQWFSWIIYSIGILLSVIHWLIYKYLNVLDKYKYIVDLLAIFSYTSFGLNLMISLCLCILGLLKPWIIMIWVTALYMEIEKNLQKFIHRETTFNMRSNFDIRNTIWSYLLFRSNFNITNHQRGTLELVDNNNNNNNNNNNDRERFIVIPVSSTYFRIHEVNPNSCIIKLPFWGNNNIQKDYTVKVECKEQIEVNSFCFSNYPRISIETPFGDKKSGDTQINYKVTSNISINDNENKSHPNFEHEIDEFEMQSGNCYCSICFLECSTTNIFSPCGHGCVCIQCLGDYIAHSVRMRQHPTCHICRERISKILRISLDIEEEWIKKKSKDSNYMNNNNNNNNKDTIPTGSSHSQVYNVEVVAEVSSTDYQLVSNSNSEVNNYGNNNLGNSNRSPFLRVLCSDSILCCHPEIRRLLRLHNNTLSNRNPQASSITRRAASVSVTSMERLRCRSTLRSRQQRSRSNYRSYNIRNISVPPTVTNQ